MLSTYNIFENLICSADGQELSKTALGSRGAHLEVGDRGATVDCHTPCFHVNLHCVARDVVNTKSGSFSRARIWTITQIFRQTPQCVFLRNRE